MSRTGMTGEEGYLDDKKGATCMTVLIVGKLRAIITICLFSA
ncbi:hypothetical protein [Wolbachia endosymbiont (group A) of Agelastica alni]